MAHSPDITDSLKSISSKLLSMKKRFGEFLLRNDNAVVAVLCEWFALLLVIAWRSRRLEGGCGDSDSFFLVTESSASATFVTYS